METLEEKQQSQGKHEKLSSNMCCLEKAEALFVTSDVSNHALPIWKPMYFVPSAIWEAVPWLSAAQGVHVPFFLHPSGPVGLPAEFSVKWSKCLLCYLRIEGRLTKHMGPVEPVRMIKKKKRHYFGGCCPNLDSYNLVKQKDEFRHLHSNFWQVWHSWFWGKMVVT